MSKIGYGQVTIGSVTLGNLCPDGSYNLIPVNYFAGTVQFYLEENNPSEIQGVNGTDQVLRLSAPTGFEFRPGVGSLDYNSSGDMSNAVLNVTATEITVTVTYPPTGDVNDDIDYLDFNNIEVRAITANTSGNIARSGLTAYNINGFPDGTAIASLSSAELISITSPPENTTVCETSPASFSVVASGGTLNYQWQENDGTGYVNVFNGGIYSGANSATLDISSSDASMDGYSYRVSIENTNNCSETSTAATLNVDTNTPTINSEPGNETLCEGDNATFIVGASGDGLSYQWQEDDGSGFTNLSDGGLYSGVNTTSLTITNATTTLDNYDYQVIINGTCGSLTSNSASLEVNPTPTTPTISFTKGSNVVCDGANPDVTLSSSPAPNSGTYEWFKDGTSTGITTQEINISDPGASDDYSVQVTDGTTFCVSETSIAETITIYPLPNNILTVTPSTTAVCDGEIITFTINGSQPGVNYQLIDESNTALSGIIGGNGSSISITSDPFDFATFGANQTITVRATNATTGCTADLTDTESITINELPEGTSTNESAICSNEATNYTLSATDADTYNISINSNGLTASAGNPVNGSGKTATEISDDAWTNTTGSTVNVEYEVTPVSSANCLGSTYTITFPVLPEPIIANNINATICSGDAIGVTLPIEDDNNNTIDTYDITAAISGTVTGTPTTATGTADENIIAGDVFSNTSGTNATVTYTITPYDGTCSGNSFDIIVTVYPEPVVAANISTTICSGDNVGIALPATDDNGDAISKFDISASLSGVSGTASTPNGTSNQNAILNDNFTNTSNVNGNVTYTITPYAAGCPGTTFDIIVTVEPEPVVAADINATVCSGDAIGTNLPATDDDGGNISSYDITASTTAGIAGTPTTATGTTVASIIAGDIFSNTSGANATVTYTITPYFDTCPGASFDVIVTVEPEPIVAADINANACSGDAIGITLPIEDDNNNTIDTYDITAAISGTVTGTPTTATGTADENIIAGDVFSNTSGANATVTYTITPYDGTCSGNSFDIIVTVYPEPVVAANISTTICSGDNVGIALPATDDNGDAISKFDISASLSGVSGTASTPNGTSNQNAILNDNFTNTSNVNGNVTYTITPYAAGCPGTTFDIIVTVEPEPVVAADINATVCSGDAIGTNLPATDDDGGNISSYDITASTTAGIAGTPTTATGTTDATIIAGDIFSNTSGANATVTYTITPYFDTCPGASFDVIVTVEPEPIVAADINANACSGDAIGVTLPIEDDNNNTIDTYDITAAISGTVTGTPTTATGTADENIIAGDIFSNTSGANATVTYTITPYDGTCSGNSFDIIVTVYPEPVVAANISTIICSGDNVGIALPATDDNSNAIDTYDITAAISGTVTGTPTNATGTADENIIAGDIFSNTSGTNATVTYTITPYDGACPGASFDVIVTVEPEPIVAADINATVCSGDAIGVTLPSNDDNSNPIDTYDITAAISGTVTGTPTNATGTADENIIAGDIFSNTSGTNATVTYTITPYDGACPGASFDVIVTVEPEPIVAADINATVCSGDAIGVTLPSNDDNSNAIDTYDITAAISGTVTGTPTNATGTADENIIAGDIFSNTSGTNAIVTYTITPYDGACPGASFDVIVTVEPEPIVAADINATVCSGDAIGVTLPSNDDNSNAIDTYDITAAISGTVTGTPTTATGTADENIIAGDIFSNTSGTNATVTYTITPYDGACPGASFDVIVTVEPEPIVAADINATVCSGDAIGVTLPSNDDNSNPIDTYDITAAISGTVTGTPTNATGTADENIIAGDIFSNTSGTNATVTYTITPYDGACPGASFDVIVTVEPEPIVAADINATVCSGDAIGVTLPSNDDNSNPIDTYDITAAISGTVTGTPTTATGTADENIIAGDIFSNTSGTNATVTYTITPYDGACPGASFDVIVTVEPEPIVAADINATVCSGDAIGVTLPSNDDNSNPIDTYDITAAISGTVTGTPTTATGTADENIIAGDIFSNTSGTNATVTYTITPYDGACPGASFDVIVTVEPEPIVAADINATVCSGDAIGVTLPSNDDNSNPIDTYDITAAISGTVTGTPTTATGTADENIIAGDIFSNTSGTNATVTYTITPYDGACPGASFDVIVTVEPEPIVAADINATVCSGDAIGVTLPSNDDNSNPIDTYDITAAISGTVTGTPTNATGTADENIIAGDIFSNTSGTNATVTYTITPYDGACPGASFDVIVTVEPEPIVAADINATVCSGDAIGVTLPSNDDNSNPIDTYDITAAISGTVTGTPTTATGTADENIIAGDIFSNTSGTNATVTYTITPYDGACPGASFDVIVTVEPEPIVAADINATVCSGDAIGVTLPSNDDNSNPIDTYDITAAISGTVTGTPTTATGTADENIIAGDIFSNTSDTNATVTYTITPYDGACPGASFDVIVTVEPEPISSISTTATEVCESDPFTLTGTIAGGADTGEWRFKPGQSTDALNSGTLSSTSNNGGNWEAVFTPNNSHTGSDVTFEFIASGSATCPNDIKEYTLNIRSLPDVMNQSYSLCEDVEGDGLSNVNLTDYNEFITSEPEGNITIEWFTNSTLTNTVSDETDENVSNGSNYYAKITFLSTNCFNVAEVDFIVDPLPTANTVSKSYCENNVGDGQATVNLTFIHPEINNQTGNFTFEWFTASNFDPTSKINDLSSYTVADSETLYVNVINDDTGCENNTTVDFQVLPEPDLQKPNDITVCSFDNIITNFSTPNVSTVSYSWTNDNTATGIAATGNGNLNVQAAENTTGVDIVSNITVTATSNGCVSDVETFIVTVKPKPVIGSKSDLEICSGDNIASIDLTDDSGGVSTISWTATNASAIGLPASSGTGDIPAFTANNNNSTSTITSNVTVTSNWNGCVSDQMNFQIRLKPTPLINAVPDENLCAGENYTVNFSNSLPSGTDYNWVNDNTNIGLPASGSGDISFTTASNTTGSSIIANIIVTPINNLCEGPQEEFTLTLNPTPVITTIDDVEICSEETASIPISTDLTNVNFSLNVSDNSIFTSGPTLNGQNIEFTTSINTSGTDKTSEITLTAEKDGCESNEEFTVTLINRAIVSSEPDEPELCSNDFVSNRTFTHDSGIGSFSWEITNADLIGDGTSTSGNGNFPGFELAENLTGSEIVGYVKYLSEDRGCLSIEDSFKITLKPSPVTLTEDVVFYSGDEANVQFFANLSDETDFYWSNNNTSIGINNVEGNTENISDNTITPNGFIATNPFASDDNIATITVYGLTDGCRGPDKQFRIIVKPNPIVNIKYENICDIENGVKLDFVTSFNELESDSIVAYNWSIPNNLEIQVENDTVIFNSSGRKNVTLEVETALGRTFSSNYTIEVWNVRDISFTTTNVSTSPAGSPSGTQFSPNVDLDPAVSSNLVEYSYEWDFGDPQSGANNTSTNREPTHNYENPGTYNVTLNVITKGISEGANDSCVNTQINIINIVESINTFPYFEDFEDGPSGWGSNPANGTIASSWTYIQNNNPNYFGNEKNSSNAWGTVLNREAGFNRDENSYLNAPNFDLSSLDKPMIAFDMWLDVEDQNRAGAILEYSLDDKNWQVLGKIDDPLNWYNTNTLNAIGEESNVDQVAWSFYQDEEWQWKRVAYPLDVLKSISSTIFFRINFKGNENENSKGMAIDNFYVGERQKLVLLENFTNLNSTNFNTNRNKIESLKTSDLRRDILPLNFHISVPSPDSINMRNSVQMDARASIYSIDESPKLVIDGEIFNEGEDDQNTAIENIITRRSLLETSNFIDVSIDTSANENTIRFDATMEPNTDASNPLISYFFIIEKSTSQESELNNVVRKILPDINGVNLNNLSETTIVNYEWEVNSIYTSDELAIVSIVQERNTNSIIEIKIDDINQSKVDDKVLSSKEGFESIGINLYPNPSRGNVNLKFTRRLDSDLKIMILDSNGKIIKTSVIQKDTEETELDLKGIASGVYHIITKSSEGKLNRKKLVILD
ncbi:PKD-like domain-containing protein [Marivirga tractuosa]|uniref:PKD-like domain-containing protein n=1 Tax=Marivirga tractuosa TaxID=1006 RepID=UPI0035CF15A7